MQQFARKLWGETGWGAPASVALHLLLLLLLLVRLPDAPQPAPEQSVNVTLVPPPKPKEKSKPKPEKQPAKAAKPTAPPPQAFESASSQPEKEKPRQPELPPAAPEKGKQSEGGKPAEAKTPSSESILHTEGAQNGGASALPVPQGRPAPQKLPAPDANNPEPAKAEQKADDFTPAHRLYAKDALADPRVKQALGRLPPTERIAQICSIEALEQIRHNRPGAFPDMLARNDSAISETSLTVRDGAFRSRGQWYAIGFRCEADAKAMTIKGFSYTIGGAIPESEWAARRLPRD